MTAESVSRSSSSIDTLQGKEPAALAAEPKPEGAFKINSNVDVEDAGDGTTADEQVLHGIPLILCAFSLLLCMFLTALDMTIVATIFTTVGEKFGDFGKISWLVAGFMMPIAVLAMSWGKIAIIFGRKYTMMASIILFEIGSLISALGNSMDMIIGGRVISGIGGGGIQIMVFFIITEITTIQNRGIVQGLVGATFGIASVAGPLLGGAFTSNVSWRWCFYINLPLGGVALVVFFFLFNPPSPKGSLKEKLMRLDYVGTVLLALSLVLFCLALTLGSSTDPWNSAIVIAFFVVAGVVAIAFGIWNFGYSKEPLVPLRVVRVPQVLAACFCLLFLFATFMLNVLYLSTFWQIAYNADALHSGIDLLPCIVALVITSIVSGIVISKSRYVKPFAVLGTVVATIGTGLISTYDLHTGWGKRIGYLILLGFGIGNCFQSLTLSTQIAAPKNNGGVLIATAFFGFCRSMAGVIGSAVGQAIQSSYFAKALAKIDDLPAGLSTSTLINEPAAIRKLAPAIQTQVLEAFVYGYKRAIYASIAFGGVSVILSLLTTNKRIPLAPKKPAADDKEAQVNPEKEAAEELQEADKQGNL